MNQPKLNCNSEKYPLPICLRSPWSPAELPSLMSATGTTISNCWRTAWKRGFLCYKTQRPKLDLQQRNRAKITSKSSKLCPDSSRSTTEPLTTTDNALACHVFFPLFYFTKTQMLFFFFLIKIQILDIKIKETKNSYIFFKLFSLSKS